MKAAEEHLLKFVCLLAHHPDEVKVEGVDGQPIIFEITVREKDAEEVGKYIGAFQAIVSCTTTLLCDQYEIKILVK